MATKKQKREMGQAKRTAFEEKVRQGGLKAQSRDREIRAKRKRRADEEAERMNKRHQAILAAHLIHGDANVS